MAASQHPSSHPAGQRFENLVDMFIASTQRYRNNPLFGVKTNGAYQWITYGQIAQQVDELRAGLAQLGVGKGDVVAIISNNSPEWAVAAYATYSLGARFAPMYEVQQPKEWKYILDDCQAKVLIVSTQPIYTKTRGFIDELPALEQVISVAGSPQDPNSFAALLDKGRRQPTPPVKPSSDDICGFIYTSGTTGNPKGVLLSHGNITSNINAVHDIFPMEEQDVSLSFLPWAHSFGQTVELHCMLSYGASMGLAESVNTIIDNLQEVRPTLLFSVPRIFNRIYDGVHKKMAAEGGLKQKLFYRTLANATQRKALEAKGQSPGFFLNAEGKLLDKLVASKIRARFGGRLKYAFSGGAALSKEVATFVDNLGIIIYEGYGLTETSPISTANCPAGRKIGSVGRAIPEVTVRIEPCDGAPEGEGEIVVLGPNIMIGYHNLPEENAKVFTEDRGFRTGDMGRKDADGFVYITGRVKEQYKLENGKYVVPAPLEEKLKLSPYITQIMIDGTNRPYNIAVLVPDMDNLKDWATQQAVSFSSPDDLLTKPQVRALMEQQVRELASEFKGYERPSRFVLTAEDFTTENGLLTPKMSVKRRFVMERYKDQIDALYAQGGNDGGA
jgi:long-chain acyl-CoA synthetase